MTHTTLTRRSVIAGSAAVVTTIPTFAILPAAVTHGQTTNDMLRGFIRKLLTERSGLTAGEWIHRKIVARGLQAIIRDEGEPWEPWETELLADMDRRRRGSAWEARS